MLIKFLLLIKVNHFIQISHIFHRYDIFIIQKNIIRLTI